MLDQKKIILMSRLASYEKHEGKKNAAIGNYFRNDYIGWQVLKSVISSTIVFVILVAGYVVYNFEEFMVDVYRINLQDFARSILIKYCIFIGVYAVITYVVFSVKYTLARKSLRRYSHTLSRLAESYREDDGGVS